jgi:integrase
VGVYFRKDRNELWFKIEIPGQAKPKLIKSDFKPEHRAQAELAYLEVVHALTEGRRWDHLLSADVTVRAYGRGWCDEREKREIVGARNERTHLELHVYPVLGDMKLADVRPRHVEDLVEVLRKKPRAPRSRAEKDGEVAVTDTLSSRTVIHVIESLRAMFTDAVVRERAAVNPCTVRRGVMPTKKDKQINRKLAVFVRSEVELLLSDRRIPADRRTLYGLLFLAGLRPEEENAITWRDYDGDREPLGALGVSKVYSRELKRIVGHTKTEADRDVPVHQTLSKLLSAWRLEWPKYFKRQPELDDLIVPSRLDLSHRGPSLMNQRFKEDCTTLGLRVRNIYCARRTFISLARAAGGHKEDLRWVSHGVRQDQIDDYTTPDWSRLCGVISPMKVGLLDGQLLQLRVEAARESVTKSVTNEMYRNKKAPKSENLEAAKLVGAAGFEPATPAV